MDNAVGNGASTISHMRRMVFLLVVLLAVGIGGTVLYSFVFKGGKSTVQRPELSMFKPLESVEALNDCGLTKDAQQFAKEPYVRDVAALIQVAGTLQGITYPSETEAVIMLSGTDVKGESTGKSIKLPVTTVEKENIKNALLVREQKVPTGKKLDTLAAGDKIVVQLYCRPPSSTMFIASPNLAVVKIGRNIEFFSAR